MSRNNRQEMTFKSVTETEKALGYVEKLLRNLKKGPVRIGSGEQSVAIEPQDLAKLVVEAVQKGDRDSVTIKLVWRKEEAVATDLDLEITPATAEPASS